MIFKDILLAGAAQGFMLCTVMLCLSSSNALANRLLALFIALESFHLFLLHFVITNGGVWPVLMLFLFSLRGLAGPALYLYARAITDPGFQLNRQAARHLLVLLPSFTINLLAIERMQDPTGAFDAGRADAMLCWVALSIYHSLVVIAYAVTALRHLRGQRHRLEQVPSRSRGVSLNWLKVLAIGLIAIQIAHLGLNSLKLAQVVDGSLQPAQLLNTLAAILMIYLISLGGLRQPKIFTDTMRDVLGGVNEDKKDIPPTAQRNKYTRSGLDERRRQEIWGQLQNLLRTQQVYLDTELNLPGLAQRLNIRPQELSETINTEYHGTFYELINFHRIEAAKALLQQPGARHRKMLDVALSVGYTNLSSFYNQFKKFTRLTPTEYRQQSNAELA